MGNEDLLLENLLKSDFTFGFELEACIRCGRCRGLETKMPSDSSSDEILKYNIKKPLHGVSGEQAKYIDDLLTKLLGKGRGVLHNDSSIAPSTSAITFGGNTIKAFDFTFEWASPVLTCTPDNFKRVIEMLYRLKDEGIYTNNSCGFHHHLSYKGITEREMIWIYMNLCMDKSFRSEIASMEGINFSDNSFANASALDIIADYINTNDYAGILKGISDSKYRQFRIHPQGTLEWRGPREFLNKENLDIIKEFYYTKFNKLVSKIIEYQGNKTIHGTNIDKKTFFENLIKARDESPVSDDRELEFMTRTHGYMDRPLHYKTEKGIMISDKLREQFEKSPLLFYDIVVNEKANLTKYIRAYNSNVQDINTKLYDLIKDDKEKCIKYANKFYLLCIKANYTLYTTLEMLGNFKQFISNDTYLELINNIKNTDRDTAINLVDQILDRRVALPFKILYNMFVSLASIPNLYSTFRTDKFFWNLPVYNYSKDQILKLILLFIRIGFNSNLSPYYQSSYIREWVENNLDEQEKTIWNNRLIAGLFDKPKEVWMAGLICVAEQLDIKALIALCFRYDDIYSYMSRGVLNILRKYVKGIDNVSFTKS